MLELGSSGSVRGVSSNGHPYRDPRALAPLGKASNRGVRTCAPLARICFSARFDPGMQKTRTQSARDGVALGLAGPLCLPADSSAVLRIWISSRKPEPEPGIIVARLQAPLVGNDSPKVMGASSSCWQRLSPILGPA